MLKTLLAIAAAFLGATVLADDARDYTIILVGNEAGAMRVERTDASSLRVSYSFNDRGRGPDIVGDYELDDAGLPRHVAVRGVDYFKAPVDESLEVADGRYRWRSAADEGESAERGFYASLDGPPAEVAVLARALLVADDASLPLLPAGQAGIRRVGEIDIEDGERTIGHYEITGLGFEPEPVWLTADRALFAVVSNWFSVLESGQTELLDTLRAAQLERREARFREQAEATRSRPAGAVLIDNARIFDVVAGEVMSANALLVEGETIRALLEPGDERPAATTTIDARGRTLLPGLWDMHAHLDMVDGPMNLAAGVTTVRDLANDHDGLMRIVAAIEDGDVVGPHIFRAGFIDGTGPYAGPTKARIENADDGRKWIDFYADNGYHQIKIYSSIPTDLVEGMASRAHERGLRFSGHVPAGMWAEDAIRAGFDEIQHINMVFLNFLAGDREDTRKQLRFTLYGDKAGELDLDGAEVEEFIALLVENDVVIDPTAAIFDTMLVHRPGNPDPTFAAVADHLPANIARGLYKPDMDMGEDMVDEWANSAAKQAAMLKKLYDSGVQLVPGSDHIAAFTIHRELELYAEAGIPNADVLRIATLDSARIVGAEESTGSISVRKDSDLVLLDGNPLEDMSAVRRGTLVMKGNTVYRPDALYKVVGVEPFLESVSL